MSVRELGKPLGNPLAASKTAGALTTINPAIIDFVNGASGEYVIPAGYSFFRVSAVGGGGAATSNGGGGGGFARSPILAAKAGLSIAYVAGLGGTALPADGTASTATFGSYSLVGGGGKNDGSPGVGSGGLENSNGGVGGAAAGGGGGGAGGPSGNGGAGGVNSVGGNSLDGGGGGAGGTTATSGAGGGGVMSRGGARRATASNIQYAASTTREYWGGYGLDSPLSSGSPTSGSDGGSWGGGAGARSGSGNPGLGGYGGVRIELW